MTPNQEALSTIEQEVELGLDDWFDEDAADAELQRIMRNYATIIEGELEWNLVTAQNIGVF